MGLARVACGPFLSPKWGLAFRGKGKAARQIARLVFQNKDILPLLREGDSCVGKDSKEQCDQRDGATWSLLEKASEPQIKSRLRRRGSPGMMCTSGGGDKQARHSTGKRPGQPKGVTASRSTRPVEFPATRHSVAEGTWQFIEEEEMLSLVWSRRQLVQPLPGILLSPTKLKAGNKDTLWCSPRCLTSIGVTQDFCLSGFNQTPLQP